ncbi:hypothetical protein [Streptomyces johnsoniae]|uniref:Integral membrane protein n=1 Tax=Streptomyces johnsoniae TaxID=3075532 RepID=A0ABU2SA53_9ACTN|nr:hypothetical protein [Streptomyces sp. DSM 41886]MDT0445856.1 hypothetical protein [Streptomyces sp. DSM 41886]
MVGWGLRILVVLGLLGSAWVHLIVWQDWARYDDVVGPLFLVNVGAGALLAVAVAIWRGHWLPELAAVGFGAATLLAYVLSLTVGFFGVEEQFRTDEEVWGVVTEAACIVGGAALLALRFRHHPRLGGRRGTRRGARA